MAAVLAEAGLAPRTVDVGQLGLPLCQGSPKQAADPEVLAWRGLVRDYPAHVWVAPEWHGSMAGVLKNALDHLEVDDLAGRVLGLVAQAGGGVDAVGTLDHMRAVARSFRCWVAPTQVSLHPDELEGSAAALTARLERLTSDMKAALRMSNLSGSVGDLRPAI